MASGFGTYHSSSYIASGSGGVKVSAVVSQTVDAVNRQVTVKVRAMLSYYRVSGNWAISNGTAIYSGTYSSNYIRATIDGSDKNTTNTSLGVQGAKSFTAYAGSTYTVSGGYIKAASSCVCEVTQTKTFNYNANGDAITKNWSAKTSYSNTTLTVSGSFTTDSIASGPQGLTASVSSFTDTTATLSLSISDYGSPASADGRYLEGAVLSTNTYGSPYRYNRITNTTSGSVTITNADGGDLNITPNTSYYYGIAANNTSLSAKSVIGQFTTLPAYITSINVTDNGGGDMYISVLHNAEGSAQTVYTEYSYDQSNWVAVAESFHLTVTQATTLYFRRSSGAGNTPTQSVSIVPFSGIKLYGSVGGQSKEIKKLYGSVGGQSKKIKKLYASLNGRSKLIYKDN